MPSESRAGSRDRELVLQHQHSFSSDSSRHSVPMWDSSDPERAPPPLPLNPQNPNQSPTRANASTMVAAAAQALADRAREHAGPSPYVVNKMDERSPERSPDRSPTRAQHRRLQSLQTGNTKDVRAAFENARAIEWTSRPSTPLTSRDTNLQSSPEKTPSRAETPTYTPKSDPFKDAPSLRPPRTPLKPILGENTPPSATMLALQNYPHRDSESSTPTQTPLQDTLSGGGPKTPQNMENIYSQMSNLTAIATTLQREMIALSRRSKDNAADLLGLKEATNTRDEDIRRSLKEIVGKLKAPLETQPSPSKFEIPRPNSSLGLNNPSSDTKSFPAVPSIPFQKSVSLPRIPPVHEFNFTESDHTGSPSPYSVEGAASVAMLEKIIREMVTKDGQERLLSTLSELLDKSHKESSDTAKKVEQLVEFIRDQSTSRALVKHKGTRQVSFASDVQDNQDRADQPSKAAHTSIERNASLASTSSTSPHGSALISEDLLKMLQRIKDSVAQSGGLTNEVKALVRDLRSEVLGMGREIGRKLDEAGTGQANGKDDEALSREELARIVQEGLTELKDQMDQVIRAKRRDSSSSSISRSTVNSSEVQAYVQQALVKHGLYGEQHVQSQVPPTTAPLLDQDAILNAVKEAYEAYKPEIELQQFGLERDEILQCLKEGLEDYQSNKQSQATAGISREEIMVTIQEAMQNFTPPEPSTEANEIKEEVLIAVRESLEAFQAQARSLVSARTTSGNRQEMLDAIREALGDYKKEGARDLDINRQDLFEAVKAGLDSTRFGDYGDQVLNSLHEILNGMRNEFQEYSAANGRDTEQVLDALKDGLESLRSEVESYVDRAQDVTGKDEIIETLKPGLEELRGTLEYLVTRQATQEESLTKVEMLELIKSELDHLRDDMAEQSKSTQLKEDIVLALNAGITELKAHSENRSVVDGATDEILDAMKEEFEQLRDSVLGGTTAQKDEIIESLQDSLQGLHAKIDSGYSLAVSSDSSADVLAKIEAEFETIRASMAAPLIQSRDMSQTEQNNDELLAAVRDTMENVRVQLAADQNEAASESLGALKEEMSHLRDALSSSLVPTTSAADNTATILESIRMSLEGLQAQAAERSNSRDQDPELLTQLAAELENIRQTMGGIMAQTRNRIDTEEILDAVRMGLDDLRSHIEKKIDNPERNSFATGEVLDAINDGIDGIRADVAKVIDKPTDVTMSTEILDTLREGLACLRADLERLQPDSQGLKSGQVVLAEPNGANISREILDGLAPENLMRRDDISKLEVMLTQLQTKVEGLEQNLQNNAVPTESRTESAESPVREILIGIESILRELQDSVAVVAGHTREVTAQVPANLATKEDTDAIEILLANTKAKIEDEIIPTLSMATAGGDNTEQILAVETVVRETRDAVDVLAGKLGNDQELATKADAGALELLLQDVLASVGSKKRSRAAASSEDGEEGDDDDDDDDKIVKGYLYSIEGICNDIKDKVNATGDAPQAVSKDDIAALSGLLSMVKESQEALKTNYESDIGVTAKLFDDRKEQIDKVLAGISDLRDYVEEAKDELKYRIKKGNKDVRGLDEILESVEEKMDCMPSTATDIKDTVDVIKHEFVRTQEQLDMLKANHDEKTAEITTGYENMRVAFLAEVTQKLEEQLGDIILKHEEQHKATQEAAKTLGERAAVQEEQFSQARSLAEDLKLTVDTLGGSVTGIEPALKEATEKMDDTSRTVFTKIEEMQTKLEESGSDGKSEHGLTRGEVAKSYEAITSLRQDVAESHPKLAKQLSELLSVVSQHFEHSRQFQQSAQDNAQKSSEAFREIKEGFATLPQQLPQIEAPPPEVPEKYDDTMVHEKLDNLLKRQTLPESAVSQLAKIDQMHQQLVATASEVTSFVAFQTRSLTEQHESKEKEVNEANVALKKAELEKEHLVSQVVQLEMSKKDLGDTVESLKAECKDLTSQKHRLAAEVSSLETALRIRREELQLMDARADALERRIIEGMVDHSRALLIAKTPRNPSQAMNLKRVSSSSSHASQRPASSAPNSGLGAMLTGTGKPTGRKSTLNSPAPKASETKERRIASLSQISDNLPAGGKNLTSNGTRNVTNSLSNLKRSQSTRTPGANRKTSWAGAGKLAKLSESKENDVVSEESEHENEPPKEAGANANQQLSRSATVTRIKNTRERQLDEQRKALVGPSLRRQQSQRQESQRSRASSYATTIQTGVTGTDADSEYTYGTGSYMTGSELSERTDGTARSTSIASTVRSHADGHTAASSAVDDSLHGSEDGAESYDDNSFVEASEVGEGSAGGDGGQLTLHTGHGLGLDGANDDDYASFPQLQHFDSERTVKAFDAPPPDHHYDSGLGSDLPTAVTAPTVTDFGDYFEGH